MARHILDIPLADLERAVGFKPDCLCVFCDEPVEQLSLGGAADPQA